MRERQEFLDRYFVFSDADYEPPRDWTRTNGLVEEIRQSLRDLRERADVEEASRPTPPPPHAPSESIDLPSEVLRPTTTSSTAGAPTSAPAAIQGPAVVVPLTPQPAPAAPVPAPPAPAPGP